jgi:hypothetical protein
MPKAVSHSAPPPKLTPAGLTAIRLERQESKAQFGVTLKRMVKPNAKGGYSKQYIHRLEAGDPKTPITDAIARAALALAAVLDGADEAQARATPVEVLATNPSIAGAVVFGTAQNCAYPPCRVRFVPRSWNHRYHAPKCKQEHGKWSLREVRGQSTRSQKKAGLKGVDLTPDT